MTSIADDGYVNTDEETGRRKRRICRKNLRSDSQFQI